MHGEYVDQTIVQDTEIYYFDANTYDEDYGFINWNLCLKFRYP